MPQAGSDTSTSSTTLMSFCSSLALLSLLVFFISTQTDRSTPLLTFTCPHCSLLGLQLGLCSRDEPKCLDVTLLKCLNAVQRAHRCVQKGPHTELAARGNRAGRQVRQGGIVWSCFPSFQVGLLRVWSTDLCSDGQGHSPRTLRGLSLKLT